MTILLVLALGATFAALLWFTPPGVQIWIACGVMGLLPTHSTLRVPSLIIGRIRGRAPDGDDAASLHDYTGIPEFIWFALLPALIAWCWWTSFWMLWPIS